MKEVGVMSCLQYMTAQLICLVPDDGRVYSFYLSLTMLQTSVSGNFVFP